MNNFLHKIAFVLLTAFLFVLVSCDREEDILNDTKVVNAPLLSTVDSTETDNVADTIQEPPQAVVRPVVMLHGFLASGDTYANTAMRFNSNQYSWKKIHVFDWNSLGFSNDVNALDAFIDQVITETGADKVDLAGHSAGSGFCYSYLSDATRAAKVAHYAHLAGNPNTAPAGPNGEIPTINIYSTDDLVVAGGNIPGASNVVLTGKDHYQVATSAETFEAMYAFFNDGTAPQTTEFTPESQICIAGKVLTLGENQAQANATVNIYSLDPETGYRISETPTHTLSTDANGKWGPVAIEPNTRYEFQTNTNQAGDRTIIYYREAFVHSNFLVYLRTLPSSGIASLLLSGLPEDDNQTVMAIFTANQAAINGRDQLAANGNELSTAQFMPASKSIIASFLYDANSNAQSDNTAIPIFNLSPTFLTGIDQYFPTQPLNSIALTFNGRSLNIPSRGSASEGVIVAVFD